MDIDRLAYALTILTVFGGFCSSRDAFNWHPDRARIVEVIALEDGDALVTQSGDAGSFLSRMHPDGARAWMTRVPGDVEPHSLATNQGMIAVEYTSHRDCGLEVLALDGTTRWQHALDPSCEVALGHYTVFGKDTVVVWPTFGEVLGLSMNDGSVQWQHSTAVYRTPSPASDGTVMIRDVDRDVYLDPKTGDVRERSGCLLGADLLVLHQRPDHDLIVGESGFSGSLDFGNETPAALIGCATYRGEIAVLVVDAQKTTRLALFDHAGHLAAEHVLPRLGSMYLDADLFSAARQVFIGELPRVIPLVERDGSLSAGVLVDVESGQVLARTAMQKEPLHALRDGALPYFVEDFNSSLLELQPGDHAFRVRATTGIGMFDTQLIGGGVVWTFDEKSGSLSAPAIKATRARVI